MQMIEYGATELMYASNGRKLMKNSEIEENDIAFETLTWEIHPNIPDVLLMWSSIRYAVS